MHDITGLLAANVTPWFNHPGLVGGLLGAAVGVLGGGIYGPMVGILAPKGKARGFVLTYHFLLLAAGVVLTVVGLVAIFLGQPYGVWYALLLPGLLLTLLFSLLAPPLINRYREAEARRLEAEEFRRAGEA